MSPQGTAAYDGLTDLPPLVERAVAIARREGFANSCRPEQGRLLLALAAGAQLIGETGTGCGVGLAPRFNGQVHEARLHWLTHADLDAAELRLAPDLAALVATRRFG